MPSPFPGMDPYLEGALWMNVHAQLSTEIARQLAPKVRPRYVVLTTEWFVVQESNGLSIATARGSPDVGVVQRDRNDAAPWSPETLPAETTPAQTAPAQTAPAQTAAAQTAAAQTTPAQTTPAQTAAAQTASGPLELVTVVPERVLHISVEIRDREHRQLVTAIEVLSPSNKRGEGRDEYIAKRRRVLMSSAHLLEIDLLHEGQRVPMRQPLPEAAYFFLLSRAEKRPVSCVWPIRIWDPLPTIPVPLQTGDADVALDLSSALATIYDLLSFDLSIDYSRPPGVCLTPEESRWVEQRLRDAGYRG